jgi:hypothetical protein
LWLSSEGSQAAPGWIIRGIREISGSFSVISVGLFPWHALSAFWLRLFAALEIRGSSLSRGRQSKCGHGDDHQGNGAQALNPGSSAEENPPQHDEQPAGDSTNYAVIQRPRRDNRKV